MKGKETALNEITIRPFNPQTDMHGVRRSFVEGFHHILWPLVDTVSHRFVEDAITVIHQCSPHSFVAEENGEVGAFLLGAAPVTIGGLARMAGFGALRMSPGFLTNTYGFRTLALRHMARMGYGYAPFLTAHPHEWPMAEITLFAACNAFRGRGTGKLLMDAFTQQVRKTGMAGAYVCTDTALSYPFYEAYGFSQVAGFPMRAYKISLPGQIHEGRVYYLPLNGSNL